MARMRIQLIKTFLLISNIILDTILQIPNLLLVMNFDLLWCLFPLQLKMSYFSCSKGPLIFST